MTTLTGVNFTVIKIGGLPLLRILKLPGDLNSQIPYFQIFCRFCGWETARQNKHSRLSGIKELRKVFHHNRCNTLLSTKINLTNLVHHQMHRMHFVRVQNP